MEKMYSAVYIPSASPEIPLAPCGATVDSSLPLP